MLDANERIALLRLVLGQPRTARQVLGATALYSAQAVTCTALLLGGYHLAGEPGATWAIISAVLVLQPGLVQSLSASAVRIMANVVGALVALAVGRLLGTGAWQLVLALVLVVILCNLLRLDLALRIACTTVVIIMMTTNGEKLLTSSIQRSSAVIIGCGLAVVVQMLVELIRRRCGWAERLPAVIAPPPGSPAK